MICKICGANNPDGATYCDDCGAPLIIYNVQIKQPEEVRPKLQIPENYRQVVSQPQQAVQQQISQPQQAVQQQQISQPQQAVQQQISQPQQVVQQQISQPQQAVQQQISQPQQAVQQQISQGQNTSAPKKKHKGFVAFIVVLLFIAALATVFFVFIMPKLKGNNEPKGEYKNKDFGGYLLFDDGVYAVYDKDEGYELGTYEVKGDGITFTDVNGSVDYGKYNSKDNIVEYGYEFTLNDEKEKFDVNIDDEYVKALKSKIKDAACDALNASEVFNEAEIFESDYYIYGKELSETHTEFTKALSDNLNYGSDSILQYLLEENYIAISVSLDLNNKTADVVIY